MWSIYCTYLYRNLELNQISLNTLVQKSSNMKSINAVISNLKQFRKRTITILIQFSNTHFENLVSSIERPQLFRFLNILFQVQDEFLDFFLVRFPIVLLLLLLPVSQQTIQLGDNGPRDRDIR